MKIKIRIKEQKTHRGRPVSVIVHTVDALAIKSQDDNTTVCELLGDCAGFKKGHLLAVYKTDFNI